MFHSTVSPNKLLQRSGNPPNSLRVAPHGSGPQRGLNGDRTHRHKVPAMIAQWAGGEPGR